MNSPIELFDVNKSLQIIEVTDLELLIDTRTIKSGDIYYKLSDRAANRLFKHTVLSNLKISNNVYDKYSKEWEVLVKDQKSMHMLDIYYGDDLTDDSELWMVVTKPENTVQCLVETSQYVYELFKELASCDKVLRIHDSVLVGTKKLPNNGVVLDYAYLDQEYLTSYYYFNGVLTKIHDDYLKTKRTEYVSDMSTPESVSVLAEQNMDITGKYLSVAEVNVCLKTIAGVKNAVMDNYALDPHVPDGEYAMLQDLVYNYIKLSNDELVDASMDKLVGSLSITGVLSDNMLALRNKYFTRAVDTINSYSNTREYTNEELDDMLVNIDRGLNATKVSLDISHQFDQELAKKISKLFNK